MRDRTIVFINPGQFGYKAGYYYYCKYLKELDYRIKFICFDQGYPKMDMEGINLIYIPFYRNKIRRTIYWFKAVYSCFRKHDSKNTVFFLNYFKFCVLFSWLFPNAKKVLDIRTGSIHLNHVRNTIQNFFIRQTTQWYRHITILSEGLIEYLKLNRRKCHVLPLGSEMFSDRDKTFDKLKLLYVGTLNKRRIFETIKGLHLFIQELSFNKDEITYDIFGAGSEDETKLIKDAIQDFKLDQIVKYHGRKNHKDLQHYFDYCNVGVSYVPMTDFFEYQPPTKTFEYVLSGMVCIATSTYENKKLITEENGILCEDNGESFKRALEKLYENRDFSSKNIKKTLEGFTWNNIVKDNLHVYLENNFNESIN